MPWYLHHAFKNSPAIAPHPDSSPSLLRTASCSARGRACVFPGCCVHLVMVVVMPVLDHCGCADCAEFAARSGRRTLVKWGGYRTVSVRACPVSAGQPVSVSAAAVVRCANASSTGDAETHDDLCVKLIKNADEPERKGTPLIKPGVSHRCALVLFWKVWLTAPRLLRLTWQRSHRTMVPRPTHCYIIAAFSTVRWRDLDSNIK